MPKGRWCGILSLFVPDRLLMGWPKLARCLTPVVLVTWTYAPTERTINAINPSKLVTGNELRAKHQSIAEHP